MVKLLERHIPFRGLGGNEFMSDENKDMVLARTYIQETGVNVLLTGRAGTGKTTFLRSLRETCAKRMIVVAPTGVAAINAGGTTIHSFFQLPLAPFVPDSTFRSQGGQQQFKFGKLKRNIIRSLDLLVIDEISMVRADVLDAIDDVLRRLRRSRRPFGGVQLLMIGDMAQLSPVVKDEEQHLLGQYYRSPYFFDSHALQQTQHVSIELKHVYRQTDQRFLDLLGRVRENRLDAAALQLLNSRYIPGFVPKEDGFIRLTTHNRFADDYNQMQLLRLPGKTYTYKAEVKGEFPSNIYPVEELLRLKVGAQVMFCKNDTSPQHQYFNGKVGRVVALSDESIVVRCPEDTEDIAVNRDAWENSRYTLDAKTREIVEDVQGVFLQYPLRLAWAITIHKSQGLTFDRCVVEADEAFAAGQVYVALSRCRTLEGLVLSAPIRPQGIMLDQEVQSFMADEAVRAAETERHLPAIKLQYVYSLVSELFDFTPLLFDLRRLTDAIERHAIRLYPKLVGGLRQNHSQMQAEVVDVAARFQKQYAQLLERGDFDQLKERIKKAAVYFLGHLQDCMALAKERGLVEVDNQSGYEQIAELHEGILMALRVKTILLNKFSTEPFTINDYLHTKALAALDPKAVKATKQKEEKKEKKAKVEKKKEVKQDSDTDDVEHPALFKMIRQWRAEESQRLGIPAYLVLPQKALINICNLLPQTLSELGSLKGVGRKTVENYGSKLLELVNGYVGE